MSSDAYVLRDTFSVGLAIGSWSLGWLGENSSWTVICGYVADVMLLLNLAIPQVEPRSPVFITSLLIQK